MQHHQQDYQIEAEWHFHATSHGKGPCDGIGGTLKRGGARSSIVREYGEEIPAPLELYNWAKKWNSKVKFCYTTKEDHEEMKTKLESRFQKAITIKGTQAYHAFIPHKINTVKVQRYSNSEKLVIVKISK